MQASVLEGGIFAELRWAWESGLLRQTDRLVYVLMRAHFDADDPYGALAVLERHDSREGHWFQMVGGSFEHAGDLPLAIHSYRTALALAPGVSRARMLIRLDPEAVVEILERPIPEHTMDGGAQVTAASLRGVRVEALRACSRSVEALLVIEQMLADDPTDNEALDHLAQLDPEATEVHLRELVRNDPAWSPELAAFMAAEGRVREASDLLVDLIAGGGQGEGLYWELSTLAPARSYELLWEAAPPPGEIDSDSSELWGHTGDELFRAGEMGSAVEAWCVALSTTPEDPDEWYEPVSLHAPERLIPLLERRVSTAPNDEFWGALGDAYWVAAREGAAVSAWESAAQWDPSDDEWTDKLAAVGAGRDPLE